jgi:hypothetical protein
MTRNIGKLDRAIRLVIGVGTSAAGGVLDNVPLRSAPWPGPG